MSYSNIIFSRFDFLLLQIVLQEAEIMNQGKTVFAQIMSLIPRYEFDKCVKRYNGNRHAIEFKCRDQFMVMSFAQFTGQDSLRSIDATLVALSSKLYTSGIKYIQRSTLAHINGTKDWRIYHDFGQILIAQARHLYRKEPSRLDVDGIVFAFDSSTMKLCLQLCPWARLHHDKGGVKMHTLYDVKTDIPSFFLITNADLHDSKVMNEIPYEPDALYIFDRAYMDTEQLTIINTIKAFFVVREKRRMSYTVIEDKQYNNPITGVMADQTIQFSGYKTRKQYSSPMRRITFYDKEGNRTFVFYTNNSILSAEDIALAYKYRWRVELFFKWMKQHLHVKEFYGTTENAVKIQLYSAIIAYCLVAIVERKMKLNMEMYDLLRILSVSLLDRTPLVDLLGKSEPAEKLQTVRELSLKFI